MHRRWAARIIVRPYGSLLGAVQPFASSLGGTRHRSALRVVVGPYAALLGPSYCRSALRLVVGGVGLKSSFCKPSATLLGLRLVVCQRWARQVVVWFALSRWALPDRRGVRCAGGGRAVGKKGGQWGTWKLKGRK